MITFTITKEDAWKQQWRSWKRSSLRLTLRLCALPVTAYYLCQWFGLDPLLTKITAAVVGMVPVAALFLAVIDALRKVAAVRAITRIVWAAEIGEFDFHLGSLGSTGHYYHWTRFMAIEQKEGCLFFVLANGTKLSIPESAFANSAACQAFLAEARSRWEAARFRQSRQVFLSDDTVWPPAPRPNV